MVYIAMKAWYYYNNNAHFESIVVTWGKRILICHPTLTLKCGKSILKGPKWQQYPSKWKLLLLLLISHDHTNVGH